MKKQIHKLFLLILIFGACSSSKKNSSPATDNSDPVVAARFSDTSDISGLAQITGALNYSGNEPFAVPTIFLSDTLSYKLTGDETFMDETYPEINGQNATLYGNVIQKGALTYFQVHFYSITTE